MHLQCTCNATACNCNAPEMQLQCNCNSTAMQLQCKCNAIGMQLQCNQNAPSMHLQCTCNPPAMHLQCTYNAPAMHLQCICNATAIQLPCNCNAKTDKLFFWKKAYTIQYKTIQYNKTTNTGLWDDSSSLRYSSSKNGMISRRFHYFFKPTLAQWREAYWILSMCRS